MAYDIISELGFGAPFGFVATGSDVGGLIKGLHELLPVSGILARLHPFTAWIKETWVDKRYLVVTPEFKTGVGPLMRFRHKVVDQRIKAIEDGKLEN